MRLTADGRTDTGFGFEGAVHTGSPEGFLSIDDILPQSDGKIVVVGSLNAFEPDPDAIAVARYTENGRLDPSLGSGGFKTVLTPPLDTPLETRIVRQSDGRYVIGTTGFRTTVERPQGVRQWLLMRLASDGQVDTRYGGFNGRVVTAFSAAGDQNLRDILYDSQEDRVISVGDADIPGAGYLWGAQTRSPYAATPYS